MEQTNFRKIVKETQRKRTGRTEIKNWKKNFGGVLTEMQLITNSVSILCYQSKKGKTNRKMGDIKKRVPGSI